MKTKRIFSLMGATFLALGPTVLAAVHGGGGGGFGGGRPGGGAFHSSARGFSGGRPAYFYSRGMGFAQPGNAQMRTPIQQSHSSTKTARIGRGITNSAPHSAQRAALHASTPSS